MSHSQSNFTFTVSPAELSDLDGLRTIDPFLGADRQRDELLEIALGRGTNTILVLQAH